MTAAWVSWAVMNKLNSRRVFHSLSSGIFFIALTACVTLATIATVASAQPVKPVQSAQPALHDDLPEPGFSFHTFFVTRPGLTDPAFEKYLEDAKPQIVQVGFHGPMLHSHGITKGATGYPMNLPAQGVDQLLAIYRDVHAKAHARGLRVVGHFPLSKVIGTWKDKAGFYDFYNNHWDEKLLGPKPHENVLEIVQRDSQGNPIEQGRDARTTYVGLCLSSPYTRQMLKQMLKVAIDTNVDGFITWFNYRWDCVCPYCQKLFGEYLNEKYTDEQLARLFDIADIKTHVFKEIHASIPGYPKPDAPMIEWEAKRWGALQFKAAYDEIFITYGRSLKPNLILATWNHIGHVGHVEERTFLPIEQWGKGENYFWYSGGADFAGKNYNQAQGKVGDAWLLAHYIRELSNGKPFMIGKYDSVRPRTNIAEAAATGGGGSGLYMKFLEPLANERLVQYTNFVHKHRQLYEQARPVGEVALILPRQSVTLGMSQTMDTFRTTGDALVRDQVLIEVVADEKMTPERLKRFAMVIVPDAMSLSSGQVKMLLQHAQNRPLLVIGDFATQDETGRTRKVAWFEGIESAVRLTRDDVSSSEKWAAIFKNTSAKLSTIDAAWQVRATMYQTPNAAVLHLVNYAYDQEAFEALGKRPGTNGELPVAQENIKVNLNLPSDRKISQIKLHDPELKNSTDVTFEQVGARVEFTINKLNIYAVLEMTYADKNH